MGKTTTAIHLAAALRRRGSTAVVDGDSNESARLWASGERPLPFPVVSVLRHHTVAGHDYVLLDSAARPSGADLRDLVELCDLLILPSNPEGMSLDALQQTLERLRDLPVKHLRALLTLVPPAPSRQGQEARQYLLEEGVPLFESQIRASVAFQAASSERKLVYEVRGNRAAKGAWMDYEALAREVVALLGAG